MKKEANNLGHDFQYKDGEVKCKCGLTAIQIRVGEGYLCRLN